MYVQHQWISQKIVISGSMLFKGLPLCIFLLQSHISETEEEIKVVESMFPAYQNYTELYDKNKLLTNKVAT